MLRGIVDELVSERLWHTLRVLYLYCTFLSISLCLFERTDFVPVSAIDSLKANSNKQQTTKTTPVSVAQFMDPPERLQSSTSADSTQVLERIQKETQRVRRRLTNETGSTEGTNKHNQQQQQQQSPYRTSTPAQETAIEVTATGQIHTTRSPNNNRNNRHLRPTIDLVDQGPSTRFIDPVPPKTMSAHLKNEHEAFKQRYVQKSLCILPESMPLDWQQFRFVSHFFVLVVSRTTASSKRSLAPAVATRSPWKRLS